MAKRGLLDRYLRFYWLNPHILFQLFVGAMVLWLASAFLFPTGFRALFPDPASLLVGSIILVLALSAVSDWAIRPFIEVEPHIPKTDNEKERSWLFEIRNTGGRMANNATCEVSIDSSGASGTHKKFIVFSGVLLPQEEIEVIPFKRELGFSLIYSAADEQFELNWEKERTNEGEMVSERKHFRFAQGRYFLGITVSWQYAGRGYQVAKSCSLDFYGGEVFPQLHS
ncbi:MAG: hypothetical protein OK438_01960 [Thaumarchaeota archaeon]|nr:hypothetical protein [Nitrososphaerota archaeon]